MPSSNAKAVAAGRGRGERDEAPIGADGEVTSAESGVTGEVNDSPEAQGDAAGEGSDGRRRRNRGRRGGERRERIEGAEGAESAEGAAVAEASEAPASLTQAAEAEVSAPVASNEPAPFASPSQATAPAFQAEAPVSAPAVVAEAPATPAPVAAPYVLPMSELQGIAQAAGLEWVNSDADKIMAAQEAIASEPRPVHVPRERKPAVVVDEGPLILVETRKDLSQVSLPFEQQA